MKVVPSWNFDALKGNLRRTKFYLYMFIPALMTILISFMVIALVFSLVSGRADKHLLRTIFAFALWGYVTFSAIRHSVSFVRSRNRAAIVIGVLFLLPALVVSIAAFVSTKSIEFTEILPAITAGAFGLLALLHGLLSHKAIADIQEAEGATEFADRDS